MKMTREQTIKEILAIKDEAIKYGYDWPSTPAGWTDPNTATDDELTDFLYEVELFVGAKEQELSEG